MLLFTKRKLTTIVLSMATLFSFSQTETYKWDNVQIGAGGFVSSIITSAQEKDLMYARTDVGGAYRWDAANNKWIPLTDFLNADQTGLLGIESLVIDPNSPNKLYMVGGISYFNSGKTAVFKSNDYGNTFQVIDVTNQFKAHGNGMGRQNGERMAIDPQNSNVLFCGTRANGLFKSTDAGLTWNKVSGLNVSTTANENGVCLVLIDSKSAKVNNASSVIYVGVSTFGTNLYVSKDGGATFSAVPNAKTDLMPQKAVMTSAGDLYITYGNGAGPNGNWQIANEPMNTGKIMKYTPSSNTWKDVTPSGYNMAFSGISVDPNNAQRLVASSINAYWTQMPNIYGDRFFLSTDGGTTWKDLVGNQGITVVDNGCTWIGQNSIHWAGSIEFNPFNTKEAWITSGNGVFKCADLSASKTSWAFNVKGLEETVPLDAVSISGGPFVSVIGDYDGFVHSDVSVYSPIHTPRMGTSTGVAYGEASGSSLLVRVGDKMYYSTNKGTSWTECTSKGKKGRVAVSADGATILHCPENSSTVYYSTDKGTTWTASNGISFNNIYPVADGKNPSVFYAYDAQNGGGFYKSTDGGKNFSKVSTITDWGSKIIRTIPGREGEIWKAGYWDGLRRSTNGGTSFNKINSVQECTAVGFGKAAVGKTFPTIFIWGKVNNVVGIFRSIDEGTTWTRVNDENHQYGGPGNGTFVMGDWNVYGRVYMSTAGRGLVYGESSITSEVVSVDVPSSEMNYYPNPFQSTCSIESKGDFSFSIFTLEGNLVEFGKAKNTVQVGSNLVKGTYVVKIQSASESKVVKIIKE